MTINRREFVKGGAYAALAGAATGYGETPAKGAPEYQIGALYFPNFHLDPRTEKYHGKGWTEWEVLKRAEPRFPGHLQPKRPLWGYEDESRSSVFEKKIDAANKAGITHFIFDWYWYEGKPFLESALDRGYLQSANKDQVRFCLMWANHDWINLFPSRLRESPTPLIYNGTYSPEQFEVVSDTIVSRYFHDPSYYRINGAPYFSIFLLKQLVDRMGGLAVAGAAFRRFRDKTRAAGFPDLHLNAMTTDLAGIPNLKSALQSLGVRSVTSYTWVLHYDLNKRPFPATEYKDALAAAPAYWNKAAEMYGVPYHTDVSMGWDPSPRTCQSDMFQRGNYPWTPVLVNNTPELFRRALVEAKAHLDATPGRPKILTINAWNEWTEGSYLEPDSTHGMRYLDALRSVFGTRS